MHADKRVLIVYASRHGHTKRIVEYLALALSGANLRVDAVDMATVSSPIDVGAYDGAILASSVHAGAHAKAVIELARLHRETFERIPSRFVSVSMSAAAPSIPGLSDAQRAEARVALDQIVGTLVAQTGWPSGRVETVAGALLYRRYSWFVRMVVRSISRKTGAPSDTSQDYVFTDWGALDRLAASFVESLRAGSGSSTEAVVA